MDSPVACGKSGVRGPEGKVLLSPRGITDELTDAAASHAREKSGESGGVPTSTNMTTDRAKSTKQATSTTAPPTSSTTMTDSGITHTVPNSSVVTVTMHTTITTKRTSSTASADDPASPTNSLDGSIDAPGSTPTATATEPAETDLGGPADGSTSGKLSSGAIIGIAVGGALLLVILGIIAIVLIRRRRKSERSQSPYLSDDQTNAGVGLAEEKQFPQPLSTHTTGTQGSGDPFAPFGGRADQPHDPYRPLSGTFEMDGTGVPPVELPTNNPSKPTAPATAPASKASRLEPVQESTAAADPRANLNSLKTENGRPAYLSHWDQYKSLGST